MVRHLRWVSNANFHFPLWVLIYSWAQNSPLPDSSCFGGGAGWLKRWGASSSSPMVTLWVNIRIGISGIYVSGRSTQCLLPLGLFLARSTYFIVIIYWCSWKNRLFGPKSVEPSASQKGTPGSWQATVTESILLVFILLEWKFHKNIGHWFSLS